MTTAPTAPEPSIPGAASPLGSRAVQEASLAVKKLEHRLDVQEEQILEYLPFVKAIVSSMQASLPSHVDRDDLIQAGTLSLMDAFHEFDCAKDVAFGNYVKFRIRGGILDSLRDQDQASRALRRTQNTFPAATADLTAKLQRTPTEAVLAAEIGMELETLRKGDVLRKQSRLALDIHEVRYAIGAAVLLAALATRHRQRYRAIIPPLFRPTPGNARRIVDPVQVNTALFGLLLVH